MAKTIKQFDYKLIKMAKLDSRPFNPIVILNLDNWSGGNDEAPQISPYLMHEDEIDNYVDALKADLDAVGKRAKRALKNAKETTAKIVSAKNSN